MAAPPAVSAPPPTNIQSIPLRTRRAESKTGTDESWPAATTSLGLLVDYQRLPGQGNKDASHPGPVQFHNFDLPISGYSLDRIPGIGECRACGEQQLEYLHVPAPAPTLVSGIPMESQQPAR
jgi:hypothetical protein